MDTHPHQNELDPDPNALDPHPDPNALDSHPDPDALDPHSDQNALDSHLDQNALDPHPNPKALDPDQNALDPQQQSAYLLYPFPGLAMVGSQLLYRPSNLIEQRVQLILAQLELLTGHADNPPSPHPHTPIRLGLRHLAVISIIMIFIICI